MTTNHFRDSAPDPPIDPALADLVLAALADDPVFASFLAALATKPEKKRLAALRSFEFWWNDLAAEDRAKVVKSYRPDLFDREVAARAGVARETVGRNNGYKALKRRLSRLPPGAAKWRGRKRRRIVGPESPEE